MNRLTLADLKTLVLAELDQADEWASVGRVADRLNLGHGHEWVRVALVLERLAADGLLELRRRPGSNRRWYRRP